jgi:hypothetical protein
MTELYLRLPPAPIKDERTLGKASQKARREGAGFVYGSGDLLPDCVRAEVIARSTHDGDAVVVILGASSQCLVLLELGGAGGSAGLRARAGRLLG